MSAYDQTIDYLYRLDASRGWDLKLERVRAALARLGHPDRAFPSLLIAGTNGKGSTAAMVHEALLQAGHRSGLYTSPHLVHFGERIRVGRDELDQEAIVRGVERIRACAPPEETGLTFFEVGTLLALLAFAEARVDVAVLEVGLGGRLDATNAVEPVCSAIVSIGLDHTDYLGNSPGEIAGEKAGVLRPGIVTVLGPSIEGEARQEIERRAARVGARLIDAAEVAGEVPHVGLAGLHMRENAAVSLALLRALRAAKPELRVGEDAIRRAFAEVQWPGRLEVVHVRPLVILDGAHNREGARAVVAALPSMATPPFRLLFAAMADKPWRDIASILLPMISEATVVPLPLGRAVPAEELRLAFAPHVPTRAVGAAGVAIDEMIDGEPPILVTGSLFLVGAAFEWLLARGGRRSVYQLESPRRRERVA